MNLETDQAPPLSIRRRWVGVARRVARARQALRRYDRILLLPALALFIGATFWAWRNLPEQQPATLAAPWLFVPIALLSGAALLFNGLEFAVSARMVRQPVPVHRALRVSVMASAANVLPVPGAAIVRARALQLGGESLRGAAVVTMGVGLVWVGAAAVMAGILAAVEQDVVLAGAFSAGGLAATGTGAVLVRLTTSSWSPRLLAVLLLVETGSVVSSGVRLYLLAGLFDFPVGFADAVAVNLGGILSSAAGVLPGGLGLKEVLSGAFGRLAGVDAAIGVLMASVDRIAWYGVLAIVTASLFAYRLRTDRSVADDHV